MKSYGTIIFSLIFIFTQGLTEAQVAKKILVEQFSNTRCSICASRIPQLRQNMEPHKDHIQLIAHFSAAPYPSCELHQANAAGNNARVSYYQVAGSPSVFVNGVRVNSGTSIVPSAYFEERLEDTSPLEINVVYNKDNDQGDASVTLTFHGEVPGGTLKLHAYVIEKEVEAGTIPSYRQHHNVFRRHLTPFEGLLINQASPDVPLDFDFSFDVESGWNLDQLAIVAFVQDDESKEIWNASDSDQEPLTSTASPMMPTDLVLYPNPVGYMLHLKGDLAKCSEATAFIYNAQGQLQRIVKPHEIQSNFLNVQDMASGNYFLKMVGSQCDCVRPFIIAR